MSLVDPLFIKNNPALLGDGADDLDDIVQAPLKNTTGVGEELDSKRNLSTSGFGEKAHPEFNKDYSSIVLDDREYFISAASKDHLRQVSEKDFLTGESIKDGAIAGLTDRVKGDPLLDAGSSSYSVESREGDGFKINIDLTDLWKEPNPNSANTGNANLKTNSKNGESASDSQEKQVEPSREIYLIREDAIADSRLVNSDLEDPASDIARILTTVVEDIKAAGRYENPYHQRLALVALAKSVGDLVLGLAPRSDRDSISFHKIANLWHRIVNQKVSALAETEFNQEIDSPYIIGVPLSEREEIFVARTDIGSQIEQIALDRRRPSLLLYGQRRMGKTSLLKNLGRLLPDNITPLFVDLQGPASRARDYTGFLYNIARGMVKSAREQSGLTLPPLPRSSLEADPFTAFDEWLDKVEEALGQNTALLALDEFEALEGAIAKGRFDPEEVLGMLRNLIQHRPRFKVLLAGSHAIEEFQSWASYLINVQVVKIGYLKESEARQLVERPVKDFALRYEPDAVERVLQLTRCHPFLVQLLCEEIVALKNEQNPASRRLATVADVEAAVEAASSSGSFFFADIEKNQISPLGAEVLRFMAARGEAAIIDRSALLRQFASDLDSTLSQLLRRELIEAAGNGYCFQVESIRRWFA